jgi:hypothetical protein
MSPAGSDPVLAAVAASLDGGREEFGLSLLVGGSWMTGVAVGIEVWFRLLTAELGDDAPLPLTADVVAAERSEGFVHLRDARLFWQVDGVPTAGTLVRVRLTEVGAWACGVIGTLDHLPRPRPDIDLS